jgi:uncharacterized membrane protein
MQSIKDWAALGSVKNVLQFLGFADFYSRLLQSGKAADGADGV